MLYFCIYMLSAEHPVCLPLLRHRVFLLLVLCIDDDDDDDDVHSVDEDNLDIR